MSITERGVKALGPDRENLVWLTPLTLGYLFHLSGEEWYLLFGILSCGGALTMHDWAVVLLRGENSDRNSSPDYYEFLGTIPEASSKKAILSISFFIYFVSTFIGFYGIYRQFTHEDLILVGFTFAYLGGLVTWVVNGWTLFDMPPDDEEKEVGELANMPEGIEKLLEKTVEMGTEKQESESPEAKSDGHN